MELLNTSITDGLTGMSIFLAFEWQHTGNWSSVFQNSESQGGFKISHMNVGAGQGTGLWFRKSDNSGNDRVMSGSADARPGSPKVLSFTYNAGTWKEYADGVLRSTKTNGLTALGTASANVKTGTDHSFGEIIMYKEALSDNDRELVECYLGMKWGLATNLPSDHNGLSLKLPGWSVGASGLKAISTDLSGAGGLKQHAISASPYTDNLWHNLVTTFDGASRKVYLDGVEVSSTCLLYTSPSPRDATLSRMPSSA